ncbi:hypothetical protein [Streptomyces sp. IMTB 2501]|uniref:hypothetical protein n=1 Tax=Streptomyces sp. IMTB 2501 TaxID=1776340 RepID=UPI0011814FE3|nr:hypothetical protein [Streptomyces sp. IMTB 2501]
MDYMAHNAIRDIIVDHNTHRSGYGYSDTEVSQMIEAVRAVDNPDSTYVITVNTRDSEGVFDVQEYGMTYWTFEAAKTAAQWRVNRSPWALCGHVRLVAPGGASFKVGTVWPHR